jgi:hypothetical protein
MMGAEVRMKAKGSRTGALYDVSATDGRNVVSLGAYLRQIAHLIETEEDLKIADVFFAEFGHRNGERVPADDEHVLCVAYPQAEGSEPGFTRVMVKETTICGQGASDALLGNGMHPQVHAAVVDAYIHNGEAPRGGCRGVLLLPSSINVITLDIVDIALVAPRRGFVQTRGKNHKRWAYH